MVFPETAYAWGPDSHMIMGNWIPHNVTLLPPLVADSLARFPDFFLRGCLNADILSTKATSAREAIAIIGKVPKHCWRGQGRHVRGHTPMAIFPTLPLMPLPITYLYPRFSRLLRATAEWRMCISEYRPTECFHGTKSMPWRCSTATEVRTRSTCVEKPCSTTLQNFGCNQAHIRLV